MENDAHIVVEGYTLGQLILHLGLHPAWQVVPVGFHNPHSYRGYYEDLAFEPKVNVTVGEMLASCREALGKTYQGYKGGDFTMSEHTNVWISYEGNGWGQGIGNILVSYMLGEYE